MHLLNNTGDNGHSCFSFVNHSKATNAYSFTGGCELVVRWNEWFWTPRPHPVLWASGTRGQCVHNIEDNVRIAFFHDSVILANPCSWTIPLCCCYSGQTSLYDAVRNVTSETEACYSTGALTVRQWLWLRQRPLVGTIMWGSCPSKWFATLKTVKSGDINNFYM